jgi:glycosyltransferase involved in cell wall biosynthesis
MKLSIIIPVYNEESTILRVVARVQALVLNAPPGCISCEREIIVVDDGSTDGTRALLARLQDEEQVVAIFHTCNHGKGAAVRTGLQYASGDIILIQDADLEYDPSNYPRLLQPLLAGQTHVVYGSRFLWGHPAGMSISCAMGNCFFTWLTNWLHRCSLTDMMTCHKVFTREVAAQLELRAPRWGFDPEITVQILRLGYPIREIPVPYRGRTSREGKKIRWRDGLSVVATLVRYWLPGDAKTHSLRRRGKKEDIGVAGAE